MRILILHLAKKKGLATDPATENRGIHCVAGLECILNIIRALGMGSCLSASLSSSSSTTIDGKGGSYSPSHQPCSPSASGGRRRGRRRQGSMRGSMVFDSKEQMRKAPGRSYLNGATEVASLFTQQGKKGTNQDAMIVWENFGSRTDSVFCGVFDGHGPFGHMVARKVRDSLPLKLSALWEVDTAAGLRENSTTEQGSIYIEETASVCLDEETGGLDLEDNGKHPEIRQVLKESFLKAFKTMDKELKVHPNINCFCSGTTAVTLVKQGQDLVIGNVGDSRAILGTRDQNNRLVAVQLTVDLKPNLPREAERIKRCKGRVFALQDEPEVARVWLPNYDSPGLAMARAFGDFCLKDFGLISVPDISYRRLTEKDEFIVLATDGVWDVLSNKEVVDIVASAPSRSSAARILVEKAVQSWRSKYPTSKIDDCAVVCLFLNPNTSGTGDDANKGLTDSSYTLNKNEKQEELSVLERCGTTHEIFSEVDKEASIQGEKPQLLHRHVSGGDHMTGEDQWSALEGVSRVNTLLTLPRFIPKGSDEQRPKIHI
ncbi:putative protein phosphatase 2C 33 [Acorus calamus]|uniref:protein-serine/threonine phosphatase n=1 Tax=Acorus calamus TaxID=4465 RepID=A0AAV9EH76_ACOCL|nr:putative protein phosphatase 2C 33 [Acorus calamus]